MDYEMEFQLPVAISCEPVFKSKRGQQNGMFYIYVYVYFDQDKVMGDINKYGVEFNMHIKKAFLKVEVSALYAEFLERYDPASKESANASKEQKNVTPPDNPQIKRFEGDGRVRIGVTPIGVFGSLSGGASISGSFGWGRKRKNKDQEKISIELYSYRPHYVIWKIEAGDSTGLTGSIPLPQRGSGDYLIKARYLEDAKKSNQQYIYVSLEIDKEDIEITHMKVKYYNFMYRINKEKAVEALIRLFLEKGVDESGDLGDIDEGVVYPEFGGKGKEVVFRSKHNVRSIY